MRASTFAHKSKQQGAAFIVMMVILVLGITTYFVSGLNGVSLRNARNEKTADALAAARDALMGYAIKHDKRPGSLPCPDTTNDGTAEGSCSGANLIGRIPWKTLGIPDQRDGYNETLWYTLAPSFRNTTPSPYSDTTAELSLSGTSDVAAIVFSAGPTLANQQRDTNTATCPLDNVSRPANRCASNYLEGENQDNDYVFSRAPETDTFNDASLELKAESLLSLVEQRIARQVLTCLNDYAASNPWGRFPWSTQLDGGNPPNYVDKSDERFGRLPDDLGETKNDSNDTMPDIWPSSSDACNGIFLTTSGWWDNTKWKELVFYSVANRYKPNDYPPSSPCSTTCLAVTPPSANYDKKIVVVVAGKKLPGQNRSSDSDKANPSNYLEGNNATADSTKLFEQSPRSATFNDTVVFQ